MSGAQRAEGVDPASDASCAALDSLVAERVGQALHRESRCNRVSVEVQVAVDLDELRGPAVAGEDREYRIAQVLALERVCVRRLGRDGTRSFDARVPKAVHDVVRLDARPQDDPEMCQLGADLGEVACERLLSCVELGSARDEGVTLAQVAGALFRASGKAPVARGIEGGCAHGSTPLGSGAVGSVAGEAFWRTVVRGCDSFGSRARRAGAWQPPNLYPASAPPSLHHVLKIRSKNLQYVLGRGCGPEGEGAPAVFFMLRRRTAPTAKPPGSTAHPGRKTAKGGR